jgi:Carboxypeptidase regulatory-like domain
LVYLNFDSQICWHSFSPPAPGGQEAPVLSLVQLPGAWSDAMKRMTAVTLPLVFLIMICSALAQGDMRTVRGTVIDKDEKPMVSAIVHVKNVRTADVRTYITDSAGTFRFSGLDPNVDYELHAEHDNLTSNTRTISSFDTRKEIVVPLKVDKEKKKS